VPAGRFLSWPRLRGVYEQLERARHLMKVAGRCKRESARFRYLILAVYPARAVADLMLTAAERQELPRFHNENERQSRADFEKAIKAGWPHYELLETIRIHDFHRFGCLPPSRTDVEAFTGDPVKARLGRGAVAIQLSLLGPDITTQGGAPPRDQRSLSSPDGRFFDDVSGSYLPLERILTEYLAAAPAAIHAFRSELEGG